MASLSQELEHPANPEQFMSGKGEGPQPIPKVAFPQHLPKKTPIGAKMRRDAVTSSTLTIVLAPAFRF
jgi:hypothetical protein